MPCFDGREQEAREQSLSRLSAMCCSLFTYLESNGILEDFYRKHSRERSGLSTDNMRSWWSDHKVADKKREGR